MNKALLVAFAAVVPFSGFAAVLFDQTPVTEVDSYFSDGISTGGSQFYAQAVADDFTISGASTLSTITFFGASENFFADDLSNYSSFDIAILDSSFNTVASWNFATAALNPTLTGQTGSFTGASGYSLTANVNQNLAAGNYWLHVGAVNVDPQGDAFQWSSSAGNSVLAANFFDGNGWQSFSPQDPGVAFRLEGSAVPEPATMAVLGLGVAALIRRRKR